MHLGLLSLRLMGSPDRLRRSPRSRLERARQAWEPLVPLPFRLACLGVHRLPLRPQLRLLRLSLAKVLRVVPQKARPRLSSSISARQTRVQAAVK